MDLYNKNMEFFRQKSRELYDTITLHMPIYKTKVEEVEGETNFIIEHMDSRCFVHSIYNTERELEKMFEGVGEDAESIILFGIGAGDAIKHIRNNYKNVKTLVVVEPSLELFRNALKYIDIMELICGFDKFTLIINKNEESAFKYVYEYYVKYNMNRNSALVYHMYLRSAFEGYYEVIINKLSGIIKDLRINLCTSDALRRMWLINNVFNMKDNSLRYEGLMDRLKGADVIIVSAGPSLQKNIKYLNEVKDRAIIAAVGTAINILHTHGIVPHLRFAFDGTRKEKDIFSSIDTEAAPLIYANNLFYEVLPEYKGPKMRMVLNNDSWTKYFYTCMGYSYNEVASAFSIAPTTMELFCKAGCRKIIMIGQDLCYYGDKLYADNSSHKSTAVDFNEDGYYKTQDIYGNEVYTSEMFLGFKREIEKMISKYPGVSYINATEAGLYIERTKISTLKQVLESEINQKTDFVDAVRDFFNNSSIFQEDNYEEKILGTVLKFEEDIDRIMTINNQRIDRLKKLREDRENNVNVDKLVDEIKSINEMEKEIESFDIYSKVAKELLVMGLKAIDLSFEYKGSDKIKWVESVEKILFGKSTEVHRYLALFKAVVKEAGFKKTVSPKIY